MSMRILLVAPPLSDPNGPYPAIAYLSGFLETIGRPAMQADASLQVLLALMSRRGVATLVERIQAQPALHQRPRIAQFLRDVERYTNTIETAVSCLQGADHGAVLRARRNTYFPARLDAPRHWARKSLHNVRFHERLLGGLHEPQRRRLADADVDQFAFGALGDIDRARHNASGMIADVAAVIREAVDPSFRLQAYASVLSSDLPTFTPVRARLEGPPTLLDEVIDDVADSLFENCTPDLVGLSVPFAGSFYGALRVARQLRKKNPRIQVVLGGGWVNTTLRQLSDPGVFDYVDFVTLDAGERPLQCIIEHLEGSRSAAQLKRTFIRDGQTVRFVDAASEPDVPFDEWGVPSYAGLPLRQYFDMSVALEPLARHWRARWNKLTLAHGCYWKKCAFCDVRLDYIARYSPGDVDTLVSRIRTLVDATGETGFHFVDEAMPPALVQRLCRRLLDERVDISWWGNLRFDSAFLPLAPLMAEAGCVAVTGGVEAASDRLLNLMAKGISLKQVALVARAFAREGIAVHAYLIYGFPSQTAHETIDALEYVRQLFDAGCLHSARWHRFSLTAHSPVAERPEAFGVTVRRGAPNPFGNYVLEYEESGAPNHAVFGPGLERAVARYAMGDTASMPVDKWFDFEVPGTSLDANFVRAILDPPNR
jgi:hypothetical protein